MVRRKVFDPGRAPLSFWRKKAVQQTLARRDIGRFFQLYLTEFPDCTQTQLALLTEHDRSDVSNFVRGVRSRCVSDIEVLTRIADGLLMPDETRVLLGLAPQSLPSGVLRGGSEGSLAASTADMVPVTGWLGSSRKTMACQIALCGSRSDGTDPEVMDTAVRALGGLLVRHPYRVMHGPLGVGIEVMTYIADHYRPPGLTVISGRFGHANVVRDAEYVLVVGGGKGTENEILLAFSMRKQVIPFPASGGAARSGYSRMGRDAGVRSWMRDEDFDALASADADGFVSLVHKMTSMDYGERV